MQEVKTIDPKLNKLNDLKAMYDHNATVHMMYSDRFQFYSSEFVAVQQIINFCKNMCDNLKEEIDRLEAELPKEV